ncbi:Terminase small subunit [bacterium YEK0313]|nr:Terminase small subunit [bacterium YEK0313]
MPKRKSSATPDARLDDVVDAGGLTYREELFCHLYVELANASEAYRRAGGKAARPDVASAQMMARPAVARRIADLRERRLAAIDFSAEEVLSRLVGQVRADLRDIFADNGSIKPVADWPPVWRHGLIAGIEQFEEYGEDGDGNRIVTGVTKKVKLADRTRILELAGKHVDISAWRERVQIDTSETMRAMLESFARDTWVPAGETAPGARQPSGPAGPVVASVLDG